MMAPPPIPYPAVYGFFRKSADDATRAEPVKDKDLRGKIRAYVEKSRQVLAKIDDRLRGVLRTAPEVIVWGVGQLAMKLLAETALATAKIAAFVDGNPIHHGKVLRGIKVMAPEEVRRLPYPIVIATTLHHRQIEETIRNRLQLPNPIVTLPGNPFLAEEPANA
jgi:FlaA1/EpsC-like NDP-sugar epimerase